MGGAFVRNRKQLSPTRSKARINKVKSRIDTEDIASDAMAVRDALAASNSTSTRTWFVMMKELRKDYS